MTKSTRFSANEYRLIRRYLVWCYKTTKEALDRIDRYYTQHEVDKFILAELKTRSWRGDGKLSQLVKDFEDYTLAKVKNADKQKFKDPGRRALNSDYQYLHMRFAAIENAVKYFLGRSELNKICRDYEAEMTTRIWQTKEH